MANGCTQNEKIEINGLCEMRRQQLSRVIFNLRQSWNDNGNNEKTVPAAFASFQISHFFPFRK